ncbi:hypothetical protein K2173_007393 [Erythroxylum novogranatense]|uniref:EF-hand domain-containing protein n=1 Tax=Erythroxylum novogranatense TaxID=1862640 RepID=A0AAV8T628_9ROSI|nr:hypothetical protein K2173_007393 [Erythroxylum novogranatense]
MPVQGLKNREMTKEQFKEWLLQAHDLNKDGKINKQELAEAIREAGGWFAGWKAKRGVQHADKNHDGNIDDSELNELVSFAEKHLNIRIVKTKA